MGGAIISDLKVSFIFPLVSTLLNKNPDNFTKFCSLKCVVRFSTWNWKSTKRKQIMDEFEWNFEIHIPPLTFEYSQRICLQFAAPSQRAMVMLFTWVKRALKDLLLIYPFIHHFITNFVKNNFVQLYFSFNARNALNSFLSRATSLIKKRRWIFEFSSANSNSVPTRLCSKFWIVPAADATWYKTKFGTIITYSTDNYNHCFQTFDAERYGFELGLTCSKEVYRIRQSK